MEGDLVWPGCKGETIKARKRQTAKRPAESVRHKRGSNEETTIKGNIRFLELKEKTVERLKIMAKKVKMTSKQKLKKRTKKSRSGPTSAGKRGKSIALLVDATMNRLVWGEASIDCGCKLGRIKVSKNCSSSDDHQQERLAVVINESNRRQEMLLPSDWGQRKSRMCRSSAWSVQNRVRQVSRLRQANDWRIVEVTKEGKQVLRGRFSSKSRSKWPIWSLI